RLHHDRTLGEALRARALRRPHHVLQPQPGIDCLHGTCPRVSRRRSRRHWRRGRWLRMQLRGRRTAGSRGRHLATAALGVCLLGAPAFADVLPDDRSDVLYHRYEGGGITIQGPEVLVRKKVGDSLSLSASYYEDLISSASIDVNLSASPYKEQRKQWTGGFDYLHDKTPYSAGIINSKEPDYQSNTPYYSVSQAMVGDLTTLTLSYKRGWDRIER